MHNRICSCVYAFMHLCVYAFMCFCVCVFMCLCANVLIIWPFVFMHLSTETHQRISAKLCKNLGRKSETLNSKPAKHHTPPGFFWIFLPPCINLWLWEGACCIVLMLNTHKQLCVYLQIHAVLMIKPHHCYGVYVLFHVETHVDVTEIHMFSSSYVWKHIGLKHLF